MNNKLRIHGNRLDFGRGIAIWVSEELNGATYSVAKPLVMETHSMAEVAYIEPTMALTMDAAQQLMDELWTCGIRPTEGTGSAGSLAATQRHLDDMRTIANRLLDDKLK